MSNQPLNMACALGHPGANRGSPTFFFAAAPTLILSTRYIEQIADPLVNSNVPHFAFRISKSNSQFTVTGERPMALVNPVVQRWVQETRNDPDSFWGARG